MKDFLFNKYSLKEFSIFLFYMAISLLALSDTGIQLLILIEIGPGSRSLRLTAMCILFIKVLLTRFSKKEFFILAPIATLALYNYHISGNIFCVYTILVIAASKDIDYTSLFKTLFYSTLFSIVFLGILSFWEIGSPLQLTEDFGRGMIETRYCFGLHHPNIWHQAIGRCIIFACIGYYKQLNIVHLLILFVFNYFIYTLSISRTGLIAISIFLILLIFYKYLRKLMCTLFIKVLAFFGIISVYGLYLYFTYDFATTWTLNSQFFNWKVTNGRIQQALIYLKSNPINFFASRFPDDGTVFDLGAYRLFYESGYIWATLFFLLFFVLIFIASKRNWSIIIPVCVYFVFCSLYEFDPVTRPTYNIVAFFLPLLVFDSTAARFNSFMLSSQRKGNLKFPLSSSAKLIQK